MTRAAAIAAAIGLVACGGGGEGPARPVAELQDPQTCNECHPKHYTQWTASMHAYASDDPVFVAMNKRGQRETGGALGTFCVKCHAPMAVELGLTTGDLDPASLPATARGVTCYFCHNIKSVQDTHNNGLVVAGDQTMRGGLTGPVASPAHHSSYDKLMDSTVNNSEMCGSCHDVVTPRGVPLERTYEEWQTTFFSQPDQPGMQTHLTCGACHMPSSDGVIAEAPGLSVKSHTGGFHEHLWPAIDQGLTPLPGADMLAAGIKRDLDPAVAIVGPTVFATSLNYGGICLDPPGTLSVRMDSIGTAHAWPTGAAQDRRAWLEILAYDADNQIVFHTGTLPDGTPLPDGMDPEQLDDPNLFGLWDRAVKDDGTPAHMFWDIAQTTPQLLKPPVTLDKNSKLFDHSSTQPFHVEGVFTRIDHITARIRIRPLSYGLIADLVGSGDLPAGAVTTLPTLDILGTQHTWQADPATHQMGTNCSKH
ncbi:MAG TPA: multiheme c-type cytochrome [Kofleriaceae bacterium]|nr:multiheme c-type cytochrome [Kofleriaceae bacterium]